MKIEKKRFKSRISLYLSFPNGRQQTTIWLVMIIYFCKGNSSNKRDITQGEIVTFSKMNMYFSDHKMHINMISDFSSFGSFCILELFPLIYSKKKQFLRFLLKTLCSVYANHLKFIYTMLLTIKLRSSSIFFIIPFMRSEFSEISV